MARQTGTGGGSLSQSLNLRRTYVVDATSSSSTLLIDAESSADTSDSDFERARLIVRNSAGRLKNEKS